MDLGTQWIKVAVTAATLCLAMGSISTAQAQDPALGLWQTAPDDNGHYGHIRMAPCGAALCGTLERAFDPNGTEVETDHIGRQIVWDMVAQGDGAYGDGKVWSPDRDKTYSAKMTLTDRGLTVRGCVLGLCRDGGTWTRVD